MGDVGRFMKKYFIITVDVEGDNLWKPVITSTGMREITVRNAEYIERFQLLCERYHFVPTYLVDYEMAEAQTFVEMAKQWLQEGKCEIGMHMHAWNTPPIFDLEYKRGSHNPYAGEYPHEIMWKKLKFMTNLIQKQFGVHPVSHRGGRWYIDPWYVYALQKLGYKADCSVTPGISWKQHIGYRCFGNDYTKYPRRAYYMEGKKLYKAKGKGILEIPPTIMGYSLNDKIRAMLKNPLAYKEVMSQKMWLRPNGKNLGDMLNIVAYAKKSKCDYLEFMIHSSELMPGGSPTFVNAHSIEKMYEHIENLFGNIEKTYKGITLGEYAEERRK
jgi:peptidoglycan/xylan/chitin deacetylase (PgdA/CDA1 family)